MDILGGLLNLLVNFVFNIVATLVNGLMQPFINAIMLLFPDVQAQYNNVVTFFAYAFTYLTCIYRWFLFTPQMFSVLFLYFVTKFSVFVTSNVARAGVRMYNALKP